MNNTEKAQQNNTSNSDNLQKIDKFMNTTLGRFIKVINMSAVFLAIGHLIYSGLASIEGLPDETSIALCAIPAIWDACTIGMTLHNVFVKGW